jgi:CBS domain-containing protein
MDNASIVSSRVRSAASLLARTTTSDACPLDEAESAIHALTDFELDFPITVDIGASVDDALADMDRLGIHALLVVSSCAPADQNPAVVGLVTTYVIERARHKGQLAGMSVGDVMTPWDHLSFVNYDSLRSLTANDVHEMFQGTGLTHLLVVESPCNDTLMVRGVLSRATVARRLGRRPRVARP